MDFKKEKSQNEKLKDLVKEIRDSDYLIDANEEFSYSDKLYEIAKEFHFSNASDEEIDDRHLLDDLAIKPKRGDTSNRCEKYKKMDI